MQWDLLLEGLCFGLFDGIAIITLFQQVKFNRAMELMVQEDSILKIVPLGAALQARKT